MSTAFKLEFSEDDLSVSNEDCTRVDVTDLVEKDTLRWSGGIERPGDPPKDGEMSFTLRGRDFELLNPDSPYAPVASGQARGKRFFLSFLRGASWQQEYVGYARTFQPTWPGNVTFQTVEVVCGDGFDPLSDARLPAFDPPTATSSDDVVMHDSPFAFFKLAESGGTQMEAVTGNEGIYKGTPTFGQEGQIVGDPSTSIEFGANEYGQVSIDTNQFVDAGALTVECWAEVTENSATGQLIGGPFDTPSADFVFALKRTTTAITGSILLVTVGAVQVSYTTTTTDLHHVVMTWDGFTLSLYVDGVLRNSASAVGVLVTPDAGSTIKIGDFTAAGAQRVRMSNAALYEHGLTAERVLAHHTAGSARGFPQQTAGGRIAAVADLDLWDTSGIQTDGHQVLPRMKRGQSPLEEVQEAARAEGVRPLFSFNRDGNPEYRGWEWQAAPPYNEPQAIFGAPPQGDELALDSEVFRFDGEVYNEATHARIDGMAHTLSIDVPNNERRAAEPVTELILTNDVDVAMLCHEFLDIYSDPRYVLEQLTLHGSDEDALDLILDSHVGTRIRYRRRVTEDDGTTLTLAHDIVTHIVGFDAHYDGGNIVMTWKLARGIDMTAGLWRLGLVGASELDTTTVLA